MNINNVNCEENTNFKRGLPYWFKNYAKNVSPYEIERELSYKGIDASFKGEPVVAACCKKVVEIMEHYGFELPSKFSFEPLQSGTLGIYNSGLDKITINSNKREFYDVSKQNKLEESQGSYHPRSGHFLQTYLHEFSLAAHYKNLCNKLGESEAHRTFWGYLSEHSPREMMIGPLNAILNLFVDNPFLKWTINKVIPPREGLYAKTDLCEYIAEKNARIIAEDLGDNLTLKYNNMIPFEESTYDNLKTEWENGRFVYVIKKLFENFDKDIWNGDIDNLSDIKLLFTHFRK